MKAMSAPESVDHSPCRGLEKEQKQAREAEQTSAAITKYYGSLTEQEMEEDRAWGKAAESQFPIF